MHKMRVAKQKINTERERLLLAYCEVVYSVREARTMQGILEKERQIRRLMHYLRQARQV